MTQPEKQQTTRIIVVRIAEIVLVVELQLGIISLEVERLLGGLPMIAFSRLYAPKP